MDTSSSPKDNSNKFFYDSLTKEIDDLESMIQTENNENKFMSTQFLERVLSIIQSCHEQMTNSALKLDLSAYRHWIAEYIEESDKLLKASKHVEDAVERMSDYYNNGLALTSFLDVNRVFTPDDCLQVITVITNCIAVAEDLEEDNSPISKNWWQLGLIERVGSEETLQECFGFNGVSYATRNVTNTLLRILLYGLVYCWPEYKFESYVYEGGQHFDSSFMVSTDKIQRSVESEICKLTRQTGILWYEFRISKVVLDELRREFETKIEQGGVVYLDSEDGINGIVGNLKGYFEALKKGSESIIEQIDDFIDVDIIEARKKVNDLARKISTKSNKFDLKKSRDL